MWVNHRAFDYLVKIFHHSSLFSITKILPPVSKIRINPRLGFDPSSIATNWQGVCHGEKKKYMVRFT